MANHLAAVLDDPTFRAVRDWERHEAVRGAVLAYFSGVPVGPDGRWKPVEDISKFADHPLWIGVQEWWKSERDRLNAILG